MTIPRRRLLLFAGLAAAATVLMLQLANRPAAPTGPPSVLYGEVNGEKLYLDVYGSKPELRQPGLIWVHGGGWAAGGRGDFAAGAKYFAGQGYVCFSIDYRLVAAKHNTYPAQVDDVQRAVRWVRAHAAEYGVDPDRLAALGQSAGGHLVALLGTRDTRDNSDPALAGYSSRVQCVVDICGPTDLLSLGTAKSGAARPLVENFIGQTAQAAPRIYREASPLTYVDKNSAPHLIFHGAKDELVPVSQSQSLDAALKRQGVESRLVIFPAEGHNVVNSRTLNTFLSETSRFLQRHLHTVK